jgi:hypothetical protein
MYQKWPVGEQTRWWIAVTGLSSMEQPEAFLKYIEKHYQIMVEED